jgi:AcrR family transcriptional regulator
MADEAVPVRASIREAHKQLTRQLFIDAATDAFVELGYVAVTIDDIVKRAGAGRGTFYLHFDSKVAIFEAVLDQAKLREQYHDLAGELAGLASPSVDALQGWYEDYADMYAENLPLLRALHEARAVEPAFSKLKVDYLYEGLEDQPLPGVPVAASTTRVHLTALMGYVLSEGMMYLWLAQGVEMEREAITRLLAENFHASLQIASRLPGPGLSVMPPST